MLNLFWWGSLHEGHRVIHWQRCERLCVRKEEGGLGFCDLRMFNLALLGKQGWNLLTKPHTLVPQVFNEKYFPSGNYLSSNLGYNPSFVWNNIWLAKEGVRLGYRMRIGSSKITSVWNDPCVTPRFPALPDWRIRTGFGVRNHISGTFYLFFFFRAELVPVGIQTISVITKIIYIHKRTTIGVVSIKIYTHILSPIYLYKYLYMYI